MSQFTKENAVMLMYSSINGWRKDSEKRRCGIKDKAVVFSRKMSPQISNLEMRKNVPKSDNFFLCLLFLFSFQLKRC